MTLRTMQNPWTSGRHKLFMNLRSENPVARIKAFISRCKAQGMTYQETLAAVEDKLNYFPTEAEIVVSEFWK